MNKKPFFIRGLDEETIRRIKIMAVGSGRTIPQTIKYIVDCFESDRIDEQYRKNSRKG